MSRYATEPLDSTACSAADEEIYARHENDPRPNALFDENGNRKPLDPNDPSQAGLRSEWMDLYEQYGGEVVYDPPSDAPADELDDEEEDLSTIPEGEIGETTAECPFEQEWWWGSEHLKYAVRATVVTRVGKIPVRDIPVYLNGVRLGFTGTNGETRLSELRSESAFVLEAIYDNPDARLRKEDFSVLFRSVDADAQTANPGPATNFIAKIVDVLGSGSPSLEGDQDFSDQYPVEYEWEPHPNGTDKVVHVRIYLATISLVAPYENQNVSTGKVETSPGVTETIKGSILCMPTAILSVIRYWNGSVTRNQLLQHYWDEDENAVIAAGSCPWQKWPIVTSTTDGLLPAGMTAHYWLQEKDETTWETIPSPVADDLAAAVADGTPVCMSTKATESGHVIEVRGAAVNHEETVQWLIFNDPFGNLASADSAYGEVKLSAPVGLRGSRTGPMNLASDVEAVQAALRLVGKYSGDVTGELDETSAADGTIVAIKRLENDDNGCIEPGSAAEAELNQLMTSKTKSSYSGREGENNSASGFNADRGRHVYYNGKTEGQASGFFRLRPHHRSMIIKPAVPLTKAEVAARLVPNTWWLPAN